MEIEQLDLSVLHTIISNRKYGLEFSQEGSEKLLHPDLWRFTRAVLDYIKIYKEIPTKKVLLEKAGKNEGFIAYIEKTYNKIESIKNNDQEFNFNIEKLKKRYQENAIIKLKTVLEKEGDLSKNIANIQGALNLVKEVDTQKVYGQSSLKEGVHNFIERFQARKDNPELAKGIFTGLTSLDTITNGLKSPSYVLCCGSSGAGKSTLLMSMAANMFMGNNSIDNDKFYSEGNSVIFYSLEVPFEECYDKLISYLSKVPLRAIETTNLTEDQKERIDKTLKFIKNYGKEFVIVDIPKGATATQMESIFSDYSERKNKIKIVVCDYIGIMDCDDQTLDQDWQKQSAISEDLYKFARVHDLILLTGVQLTESAPSKGGENQMGVHRLSRSKGIINPSTLCLMIEKKVDENTYPTSTIHIIKSRRSALGQFSLRKDFQSCGFINDVGVVSEQGGNDQDISKLLEKFDTENSD